MAVNTVGCLFRRVSEVIACCRFHRPFLGLGNEKNAKYGGNEKLLMFSLKLSIFAHKKTVKMKKCEKIIHFGLKMRPIAWSIETLSSVPNDFSLADFFPFIFFAVGVFFAVRLSCVMSCVESKCHKRRLFT